MSTLISASEALDITLVWFERNSGWAPPDPGSLDEWLADGLCRCPDECVVSPSDPCEHGLASWWLILSCLDRRDQAKPMPPPLLAPHPDRLARNRSDYVAVIDAHHDAIEAGRPGYTDPSSGLFVQTARTLWDRGTCCEQGCRHCPFLRREKL